MKITQKYFHFRRDTNLFAVQLARPEPSLGNSLRQCSLHKFVSRLFVVILFILLGTFPLSPVSADTKDTQPIIKKDMDTILPRAQTQQLRDEKSAEEHLGERKNLPSSVSIDTNPETIKVALTEYIGCTAWVNDGQPVVRVETINFKEYVKNVLPNEWIASWDEEALKAGAIAAKNYGWRKIDVGGRHYLKEKHNLSDYPDVVDNTCDQVYLPNTSHPNTDKAVDDIWNYRLLRDGHLLINFYLATGDQCNNSPYQPCLPQWETQYRAQEGKNWQDIIHQYYDQVEISTLPAQNQTQEELPAAVEGGIYRFWSDTKQGHFYTISREERDHVIQTYDDATWKYEGVSYKASATKQTGMTPVYRFWSDTKQGHFYTISEQEKDHVIQTYDDAVWRYEGIAYYVYPLSYTGSAQTVYRFWSDTKQHHFYTASAEEKDYVIATYDDSVWKYEGEAWKVLP